MVDAVKVVADGIRLEKKITKSAEHNYGSKRRSATHDATNIGKDDSQVIINAAAGGADKSAEVKDQTNTGTSSASRTETNNEPADNAGETNDKKESEN